jgi:hypothetical protein
MLTEGPADRTYMAKIIGIFLQLFIANMPERNENLSM